jgi:hypothetical protein
VEHGAAAHGTGLECDEQLAAVEPVIAQYLGGCAQGIDFGMASGVMGGHRAVVSGGDHHTILDHHGTHRHLSCVCCGTGCGKGLCHETRVRSFIAINLIANYV